MSQRFIRCSHCGLPHDVEQTVCPATGKPIVRKAAVSSKTLPRPAPSSPKGVPPLPAQATPRPPAEAVAANAKRNLIGTTIGDKYSVRSVLGEGGMGTVYEAEHMAIGRSVAVKVLHPNQARKKDAVKRFHQEARAAGGIGHPNICEVYDLGTLDDGCPYLVMERLVGETLADRIAFEGGLPFDDVIEILTQVLSALVLAHEKRIVHRDIKPENIFLSKRVGIPPLCKILDFGVSKMMALSSGEGSEELDLTRTGMVMGTPYYMSPEQARGDRNLDARVDLYACGVIMYEALTGRRPFHAQNYNALLLQILQTRPTSPSVLRPALPHGFDEVISRAMAREREDRYQSAADFQRALGELRESLAAPRSKRALQPQPTVGTSEGSTSIDIPVTVADAPSPLKNRAARAPRPAYDVDDEAPTNLLRVRVPVAKPKKVAAPERQEPNDAETTKRTGAELDAMLAALPAEDATIDENYSIDLTPSSSSAPKKRQRKPGPDDTVKTTGLLDELAAEPGQKPRR